MSFSDYTWVGGWVGGGGGGGGRAALVNSA